MLAKRRAAQIGALKFRVWVFKVWIWPWPSNYKSAVHLSIVLLSNSPITIRARQTARDWETLQNIRRDSQSNWLRETRRQQWASNEPTSQQWSSNDPAMIQQRTTPTLKRFCLLLLFGHLFRTIPKCLFIKWGRLIWRVLQMVLAEAILIYAYLASQIAGNCKD